VQVVMEVTKDAKDLFVPGKGIMTIKAKVSDHIQSFIVLYVMNSPVSKPSHLIQNIELQPTFTEIYFSISEQCLVANMNKCQVLKDKTTKRQSKLHFIPSIKNKTYM